MKISELQIGDWLYYKRQYNAFPFKVEQITKKKVGYHAEPNENRMYYLHPSEVFPIPLTREILERNGFRLYNKEDKAYRWDFKEGVFINADFKSEEPFVAINNTCYYAVPYCMYVHQLQHALKMCGINKKIEL